MNRYRRAPAVTPHLHDTRARKRLRQPALNSRQVSAHGRHLVLVGPHPTGESAQRKIRVHQLPQVRHISTVRERGSCVSADYYRRGSVEKFLWKEALAPLITPRFCRNIFSDSLSAARI